MRAFLIILSALLATTAVRGDGLWQSSTWALTGTIEGSAGYDSNLTLSEDGPGSAFVSATPGLLLKRYGSSTKLEAKAAVPVTHYTEEQETQTDGFASVLYAYPVLENVLPRFEGGANWRRLTTGNASLGRRVTVQLSDAHFGGRLYSTGKLGVISRLDYTRQEYSEEDLNTNQRAALTVGLGYEPDPNKEISLNFLGALGRSEANQGGFDRLESRELGATLQGRGKLTAKITGTLYAGVASVRYSRAFSRSDVLPLAGGEVVWRATVRSRFIVGLDVGADFSPDGESLAVQRATLALEQTIHGPWRWRARVVPALTRYYQETQTREDRSVGAGLGFMYEPSERFEASLSYDFTTQESDYVFGEFERNLISANVSYRF